MQKSKKKHISLNTKKINIFLYLLFYLGDLKSYGIV